MARQDVIIRMRLAGEDFDREFKAKFQDLENAAEQRSVAAGTRSGGGFTKGFLGSAGLGALGAAIGTAISSSADLGAEIASTSRQFNIGAEDLQVWRQAASNAGVSAGEFNGSLASLTQKIGEANAGNRQAQQSFVDLGIGFQTTAGQARATDAVMLDLAKRISEIQDPSERVRVGTQLLGDEFKTLYPLLLNGAAGFDAAAAELDRFGGALSAKEIQDLQETNAKIEQMKAVLSIKIAGIVAENADAIVGFTTNLFEFGGAAIDAATKYLQFVGAMSSANKQIANLPKNLSIPERDAAINRIQARDGQAQRFFQTGLRTGNPILATTFGISGGLLNPDRQATTSPFTQAQRDELNRFLAPSPLQEAVSAPRVTGGGGSRRRTGGGGGAARRDPTATAAEREAERAAKEAIRNEEQLRDALARTLRAQEDSAAVQRIRTEQGEEAAAVAEAEFNFLRQHPLAVHQTVEALAAALGITKELNQADKDRLQLLINQGYAAQKAAGEGAAAQARAETDRELARQAEEAQRNAERQAEAFRVLHERAILDVADFYESAFQGGVDDIWSNFKDEGLRIIAEIAAQWTLSLIAGQPFNFNAAAGGALGRSPLASIFGGGAGGFGAANDNGSVGGIGGIFGSIGRGGGRGAGGGGLLPTGGILPTTGGGFNATLGGGGAGFLEQAGASLVLSQLGIALGGNSGTSGQIGGTLGGLAGSAFGPIGSILGSLAGNLLGGLLTGGRRGSVTVGGSGGTLGITGSQGNSSSREQTAAAGASSVIDAIFQIADQLGAGVDSSRGRVSIGVRNDSFRVDTTGRGITRLDNGARDFGSDQEGAIRFAIQDLIRDGVLTGISQASQNLLQRGGDLEAQIEKALLIEQIPKLLRQRLDPLGAALDELYDKFKLVNEALIEGSASAEQIAQARQLWELERADTIASIGAASQGLKDFLASLNAGSNSPLSLREQRAEAERQLSPFIGQITAAENARAEVDRLRASGGTAAQIAAAEEAARTAAAAINQDGFTQASQLLLSISRQGNASSGAFFSDFDRIRALTGQAIGFVDQASAQTADTRDPFTRETAQNTADIAAILADQTRLLQALNDNFIGRGTDIGNFLRDPRLFAVQ
jgi:HD-GYP domain-containing protein (c-di-GMP phosphodiesterase class II)